MPYVSPTLPNDGESADAGDISGPLLALLAVFNGHIGADNLEPGVIADALGAGSVTTSKLATGAVTKDKLASDALGPDKMAAATTVTTGATITPTVTTAVYAVTALDVATTIAAPSGTPKDGQSLLIRIKDNGTSRTIAWNAIYRTMGVTLPTATVVGKELYVGMAYNTAATKWDVLAIGREG